MNWTEEDLSAHMERLKNRDLKVPMVEQLPRAKKFGNLAERVPVTSSKGPKPHMNKWEEDFAKHLETEKAIGLISWWAFEAFKLRLAEKCTYTPDFALVIQGKLEFREVKGFWREDARVKIKVAAEMYPFRFVGVTKKRVKDGGGWKYEVFRGMWQ